MEAAPGNIIIAEMQAMTARFVMTSHPSKTNRHERGLRLNCVNRFFNPTRAEEFDQ